MLRIRFMRFGRRNQPSFRLVLVPQRSKPKGKYIEMLGSWNPITKQATLKKERIEYYLSKGAQVSDSAFNFLVRQKLISGPKRKIKIKTKKKET